MKRKAPLTLMELMVMILVFALAAALCLQAFAKSDRVSRDSEAHDRAAVACQSVAEVIRHYGGDMSAVAEYLGATSDSEDALLLFYGTDWQLSEPLSPGVYPLGYTLGASREETHVTGLGKATVWVQEDGTGAELFRLEISWQEVASGPDTRSSRISQEDQDRARQEAERLAAEIRDCVKNGVNFRETLSGETDGLGGWCRYFDGDWETANYDQAVYQLWYSWSDGKVEVSWNQTDENGVVTGESTVLFTVELAPEEVTGNG